MMFLDAQFGSDNIHPIAVPKIPPSPAPQQQQQLKEGGGENNNNNGDNDDDVAMTQDNDDESEESIKQRQALELARLNKLGIPIPGLHIKVDKMEATIWLEDLEIECESRVFADRVRAVVERAMEVTAPLWG